MDSARSIAGALTKKRAERFSSRLALSSDELTALVALFGSNGAFEDLLRNAFESARAANSEHRVAALAAIVRRGLCGDDAVISAMSLAERAVHDLDPLDVRMLMYVSAGPPAKFSDPDDPTSMRVGGVDITDLRHALAGPSGTHESVAARLVASGLVEDCALGILDYEPRWAVTEFGLEVLVFLHSHEG